MFRVSCMWALPSFSRKKIADSEGMDQQPTQNRQPGTEITAAAPRDFSHIVGQPTVVQSLEIACKAYWNDRAAGRTPSLGPFLFQGAPGVGKSLVANVLTAELALSNLKTAIGQTFTAPAELHGWLMDSDDNTAFFIDEAQSLHKGAMVELLIAVDEHRIHVPIGTARTGVREIQLNNPVFIFASSNAEDLSPALRSRMRINCFFDYYDLESLTKIVKQRADSLHWQYECPAILDDIARRSRQIPRIAMTLLSAVRRVCRAEDSEVMTRAHLEQALTLEQLDSMGLNGQMRKYLTLLANQTSPMRIGVIASTLGVEMKMLQRTVEPFMIRQGLIIQSDKGRAITDKGLEHIRKDT